MQSPNTITMLAAKERISDGFRSSTRLSGKRIRRPRPAAAAAVLIAAAAVLAGLVAAPGAAAHDVKLGFDVKSVSERVAKGTVTGAVNGSLRAEVRGRRPLMQRGARVSMDWTVRAGGQSFSARLRGSVSRRTKRVVMDGRIVSGFMAGAAVHLRGRVANARTGRLVGTMTLAAHAGRVVAPAADCADPCVALSVVRYGNGLVTSGPASPIIECGTTCQGVVATPSGEVVLTATGGPFVAWRDCPFPAGNRCVVPADGGSHCIHAFFTADPNAAPSAGGCPAAAPPPSVPSLPADRVAPQTSIASGPSGRTSRTTAVFRLRSSEAGATFRCRLDAGPWTSCARVKRFRNLRRGAHVFRAISIDAAGNRDRTAAVRRWRVAR